MDKGKPRGGAKKSDVSFKFNQGFSNAVRRPVYITDFLG
jgi:hypothetical protein